MNKGSAGKDLSQELTSLKEQNKKLNENKYIRDGEISFLRRELVKKDEIVAKERKMRLEAEERIKTHKREAEASIKSAVEAERAQQAFLKEDFRQMEQRLKKQQENPDSSLQRRLPIDSIRIAAPVPKNPASARQIPPGIDSSLFTPSQQGQSRKSDKTSPQPAKKRPKTELISVGVGSQSVKDEKMVLDLKGNPLPVVDQLALAKEICGNRIVDSLAKENAIFDLVSGKSFISAIKAVFGLISAEEEKDGISESPELMLVCGIFAENPNPQSSDEIPDEDILRILRITPKILQQKNSICVENYLSFVANLFRNDYANFEHFKYFLTECKGFLDAISAKKSDSSEAIQILHALKRIFSGKPGFISAVCVNSELDCFLLSLFKIIDAYLDWNNPTMVEAADLGEAVIDLLAVLSAAAGDDDRIRCGWCCIDVVKVTIGVNASLLSILLKQHQHHLPEEQLQNRLNQLSRRSLGLLYKIFLSADMFFKGLNNYPHSQRQFAWIIQHIEQLKVALNVSSSLNTNEYFILNELMCVEIN